MNNLEWNDVMLTTENKLQAFLYLNLSEDLMPLPVLDPEGDLNVEADNSALEAWSVATDAYERIDSVYLGRFIKRTETLLRAVEDASEGTEPADYMAMFYDAAKDVFDQDKSMIRTYFMWLYLVFMGTREGPRWGDFVVLYGVDDFLSTMRERFATL
jgi:hypothetical protein